jgi:hypothetical protein
VPSTYTDSVASRAGERVTAHIQLGEASRMRLDFQTGPFPAAPEGARLDAQRYGEPGGGGSGGHKGGGGGGQGGGSNAGRGSGDVYGDLWILYRDADGAPITETVTGPDGSDYQCVQPVASWATDPADPDPLTDLIHLVVSTDGPEAKCEPTDADLPFLMEVDFGRLNLVRSPSKVLDKAYDAALTTLLSGLADGGISVDPAGRLTAIIAGEEKTVDSPLENVALYLELMKNGNGDLKQNGITVISLPNDLNGFGEEDFRPATWLDVAAALFADGAEKSGLINLDEVVYINEFLGLNVTAGGSEDYAHYVGYGYDRQARYSGVTANILVESSPGTYQEQLVDLWLWPGMFNQVTVGATNARGFAAAANDALQVIVFIHDNAAP